MTVTAVIKKRCPFIRNPLTHCYNQLNFNNGMKNEISCYHNFEKCDIYKKYYPVNNTN